MNKIKKVLVLLSMGLSVISCSNAQGDAKVQTKEYTAKEIIKKINKGGNVLIANAIIKDDLSLFNVEDVELSAPNLFTANVTASIYFQSCVFLGDVKTSGEKEIKNRSVPVKTHFSNDVNFVDCDFRKKVDFSESEFERSISFCKSAFRGAANFNNMLCIGKQNQWWEIEADSTFRMCGTTFRGDVNMMDAKFKQEVSFQNTTFDKLQLSNMEANGEFDFANTVVNGEMLLNYATCDGNVLFSFGKFASRLDMIGSTFKGDFEMEKSLFYGRVKFNKTKFEKSVNTNASLFLITPEQEETQYSNDSIPSFEKFSTK